MSQSLGETARNALGSLKRGLNAFLGKGNGDAAPDAGDVPTGEAGVASEPAAAKPLSLSVLTSKGVSTTASLGIFFSSISFFGRTVEAACP